MAERTITPCSITLNSRRVFSVYQLAKLYVARATTRTSCFGRSPTPASSEKTSIAFLSCHSFANFQKIHFTQRAGNQSTVFAATLSHSLATTAGIFFSQSWEQRSTTHRRLVLIKLPLIPLSVLAPSPPPPSLTGGIRRGASLSRMGQKSEFNGSLCSGEKKPHKKTATVWRGERCYCVPQRKKQREKESDSSRYRWSEPYMGNARQSVTQG